MQKTRIGRISRILLPQNSCLMPEKRNPVNPANPVHPVEFSSLCLCGKTGFRKVPAMSRESAAAVSPAQFLLLLHSVPHIGEKALARLLRLNAQQRLLPEACLTLSAAEWKDRYDLQARAAAYLTENRDALLAKSAELAKLVRAQSLHLLTLESAAYPPRLERHDDAPPPILYGLGDLTLLQPPRPAPDARFTFSIAVS